MVRRAWLMTTTAGAQDRMAALKADLAALLRKAGTGSGASSQTGAVSSWQGHTAAARTDEVL